METREILRRVKRIEIRTRRLVEEIFAIIRGIHAGGTTVLLVEQNANKALSIADYGYVLETGTIALAGESQQLLRDDRVRRSYLGHR